MKIQIENLKNNSGNILLELLDTNQKRIDGKSGTIIHQKSMIIFKNIKKGKYAIRYFHDENLIDPCAVKVASTVLRGEGGSNPSDLPD